MLNEHHSDRRDTVSLCMITRNEERALPICLRSVAELVDQIVVVDTGSADYTRHIAAEYMALVVDFPWADDFAAARNESLRHASGDWILWLDADEKVDETNRQRLRALCGTLKVEDNSAYLMTSRSRSNSVGGAIVEVDQVKLFRNDPRIRWQYRVHEVILPALFRLSTTIQRTDVVIDHAGYEDHLIVRQKMHRNLDLLKRAHAERPDDPYILLYLGWTYQGLGRIEESLPLLHRSLQRSPYGITWASKLYALLVRGYLQLGQESQALAICREGRSRFPADPELLFQQGQLHHRQGDLRGAEAALLELQHTKPKGAPCGVDVGLYGHRAQHALAAVYRDQNRFSEAEAAWSAALAQRADFVPAWLGLGDIYIEQRRWTELERVVEHLNGDSKAVAEGNVLRARAHIARGEHSLTRKALERIIRQSPRTIPTKVIRTLAELADAGDLCAIDEVLSNTLRATSALAGGTNLTSYTRSQDLVSEPAGQLAVEGAATGSGESQWSLRLPHPMRRGTIAVVCMLFGGLIGWFTPLSVPQSVSMAAILTAVVSGFSALWSP